MSWIVQEHPDFSKERAALDPQIMDKLAEAVLTLQAEGPLHWDDLLSIPYTVRDTQI